MTPSTQSPDEGELIARLLVKLREKGYTRSFCDVQEPLNKDGPEAADTIERLTERVARMEEALKPFANAADMFMETTGDGFPASGIIGPDITGLTLGDLRAARLSRQDPKGGG